MHFAFDGFTVDQHGYRLSHDGREVPLERRTFDLLCYLIEHRDRVVPKQELIEQVWGARVLSEGALSNAVAKLRRALGQRTDAKQPIETVHRRGYRFRALTETTAVLAPAAPVSPMALGAVADPFVGREVVMGALMERVVQRSGGSENVIVITGEAGIGKTRTSRELAVRVGESGVAVWIGTAHEGGGAPPYWPWMQILRAAHADLSEAGSKRAGPPASTTWNACLPPGAWAIPQLVPELCSAAATPQAEPQRSRFQLFDELSSFLRAVATRRPLLVILDDLHAADRGSIELLAFVARVLQDQPVTFLATERTGELTANGDHESPLDRLARSATVLPLDPLSLADVARLATARMGEAASSALVSALHSRTQGNPLFVRQALELVQQGDRSFIEESLPRSGVPPAIRHLVRRRLAGLSERTRQALDAAAVIGRTFGAPLLCEVIERTSAELLDDLESALRLGVLDESEEAGFAFGHGLVRDCLYEDLSARERGALHARIALALTRRAADGGRHQPAALAHHALHAVPFDLRTTMAACRSAAAFAREASGFEAAAQLLQRACQKLDAEGGDGETRVHLLLELGENQFYAGLLASAWNAFREAAEAARQSGGVELLAEVAPRLVDCLELGLGDPQFARDVTEQALAGLTQQSSGALSACLLAQRAELALELPADARFTLLDQAAALASESGEPSAILDVAHSRAILRDPTCLRENAAAVSHFLQLTERYPQACAGMRYRSLRRFGAYVTRYLCALTSGDLIGADAALAPCRQIAEESHVRAALFVTRLLRAGRALGDGRLADLACIVGELRPESSVELPQEYTAWSGYLAELLHVQGKLDGEFALAIQSDVVVLSASARHAAYVAITRARLFASGAQREQAAIELNQLSATALERMPVQYGDLGALCSLAEVYQTLPDPKRAEQLYAKLLPHAARNAVGPMFEYRGAVAHFLGLLARQLGRSADAREHFQQALAINRKLDMPLAIAASERECSR